MKSPAGRKNKELNTQPVTVINDTKYISKISERTIPNRHYETNYNLEQDHLNSFLSLYAAVCVYIFLIIAIIIGGGGIAVCIVYFDADENTQNWKIGGIILGASTCIVTIILIILTTFKQVSNRPWRYQVKDILLHPENYFTDDSEDLDNDDKSYNHNNQIADTTLPSLPLLKTLNNDLVYCLVCNHLHPTSQKCIKSKRTTHSLPPLNRLKLRNSNTIKKKDKSLKKDKSNTSIKDSLSNKTQVNGSGNTANNLILKRVPTEAAKALVQQPTTKIMIVRVPNVAGELVIQPKEH